MFRSGPDGTRQCKYANKDAARDAGFRVGRDCYHEPCRKLEAADTEDGKNIDTPASAELPSFTIEPRELEAEDETPSPTESPSTEETKEERSLRIDVCYGKKHNPVKCGRKQDRFYDNMCNAVQYGGERRHNCVSVDACPKADENIFSPIQPHICNYMNRGAGGVRLCKYANKYAVGDAGFPVGRDCQDDY